MIRTLLRVRVCAAALAAPLLLMGLMLGLTGCPQSSGSSLVCNPGEVPNGGVCVACPCGSYCDDGRRATACAAGSFNANTGSSSATDCIPCPAGRFSGSTGSCACTDCAPGTFGWRPC